jgi:hypothetical protein
VCDFYADKLDGLSMKRGVLPSVPGDWTLRASSFHPNRLIVRAVERGTAIAFGGIRLESTLKNFMARRPRTRCDRDKQMIAAS